MIDMDELDDALLDKNFDVKGTKTLGGGEAKKKVMFKEFDESDPFDDSNPFEEDFRDSLKKKSPNILKDSKLVNLFGIKPENPTDVKDSNLTDASIIDNTVIKKSPLLPLKKPLEKRQSSEFIIKESEYGSLTSASTVHKPENLTEKSVPKMKSIFDNDDDVTSNLTGKTHTSLTNQAKKSSLIEDLFGSRPKSTSSIDNSTKTTFNFDATTTQSNTRESVTGPTNESLNKTSIESGFSLSASRESRRGRRAASMQTNDPLGLFSASHSQIDEISKIEEKITKSPTATKMSKSMSIEELPEWLGGPKVSKEHKQETEKTVKPEVPSSVKSSEVLNKSVSDLRANVTGNENIDQSGLTSKLLGLEFNQQSAMLNMQQQEHELRTAAALSQQSEKLNFLLESQKIKLCEQEKQFNMLISRQIERQTILEAQMKSQQDRIDSYIQTLIAQPTTIPSITFAENNSAKMNSKEESDEKEMLENFHQKHHLEKLYLENTLESLREKHEREISILEDSYKKQVMFLEEAMVQMEKRMQDEVECLEGDYKIKIQKLKEEISEIEKIHKLEKEAIKEENLAMIQEIRNNNYKNLECMQKEHMEIIQRITNSKESERKAMDIINVNGVNVENVLSKSQIIMESLEVLQKKFESKDNTFTESHKNHLLVQEKNIQYLKELLENEKETFMQEKQKLLLTIQKLELDSSELIKEFRKQNIAFNENQEIVKSKELALLRDREIFSKQTKWEQERFQILKDEWTKEQEKQLELLIQEKQSLIAEKGKLQLLNRLKTGIDDSSKIELEATIKAAQEAATNAKQERLKWQEKINNLEAKENIFREKENNLVQKAKELQIFTEQAVARREEGKRALKEAHMMEVRFNEKFSQLQTQQESLRDRENKLANEKLELARERLSFHASCSNIEKPVKDIVDSVESRMNRDSQFNLFDMPSTSKNGTDAEDIVDPHLMIFKWELDKKYDILKKFPKKVVTSH